MDTRLEQQGTTDLNAVGKIVGDTEIDRIIDNYYKLDFEDIIAGGIKTRFKYKRVESADYGLDEEDLLYADDKKLNQYVSIKKLAPYR